MEALKHTFSLQSKQDVNNCKDYDSNHHKSYKDEDCNNKEHNTEEIYGTVCVRGLYHQHVGIRVSQGAEVCHGILNKCPKYEAEADSQVDIDGFDEAVGIGERRPGSHHQSGHGEDSGHSWFTINAHTGKERHHRLEALITEIIEPEHFQDNI